MYTENLNRIRQRLRELGRPDVRIIAVSKTHGPEVITELLRAGHRDFGENRQSEARDKIPLVELSGIPLDRVPVYHHIGPLQSSGARQLPGLFTWVHGASSLHGIEALAKAALHHNGTLEKALPPDLWPMRYLIQVRLTSEETKLGGMAEEELLAMDRFPENEGLRFAGFMSMGPENGDPAETREVFQRLREIRNRILPGGELSMGMSQDWEIAVEEGATMVRLGTTIFGRRKAAPWKPHS